MAKEICISSTPHETRLAILEDDQLAEIYYERENEYTLAGSIYNGRVTRVLPGMQSAFVDVGLERDAFLYVTDFLELENPEEADELEKAAATGGNQAPREVRHANGAGRGDDNGHRSTPKQDQKPDQKQDRQPRGRLVVEPASEAAAPAPLESPFASGQPEGSKDDDSGDPGAKRWRGRRRRRGGRGAAGTPEGQSGSEESFEDTKETPESAPSQEIHASAVPGERTPSQSWSGPSQTSAPPSAPSSRGSQAPVPFVLPGESLRKYGGTAEDESPKSAPAAPVRPASSFKPATLVDAPLSWDGSGLLPGESISRHRGRQPEPEVESAAKGYSELSGTFADAAAPDAIEEQDFFAERTETPSAAAVEAAPESAAPIAELYDEEILDEPAAEEPVEDEAIAQYQEAGDEPHIADEPLAAESSEAGLPELEFEESESTTPDSDASASHHVDPSSPTGFRLFGLGKKKTEEPAPAPPAPAPKQTAVATVSAYAPGAGHIEEEVIEEEEFDAPHHHHAKTDEHDLEDYEEETLPPQLRTGDLG
jgi:ribonuclease G